VYKKGGTVYGHIYNDVRCYEKGTSHIQYTIQDDSSECPVSVLPSSQVRRRGVWPSGSGEVLVSCPTVRKMRPVQLTEEGKVRRVRGIAYPPNIHSTT